MSECYICSKKLPDETFNLCREHAQILYDMLNNEQNLIVDLDWRYHCLICGEYEDRTMVEYSGGYFCDKDIREEWEKYQKIDEK
jgi:hypothetical protein